MKKNEMIKQAKEIMETTGDKYCIVETEYNTLIQVNNENMVIIDEMLQYRFTIDTYIYTRFLDIEQREKLYKILSEYALTPIKKRKEDRYYYFYEDACTQMLVYLNYNKDKKEFVLSTEALEEKKYQSTFTENELKELGVNMQLLKKNYSILPYYE